MERIKTIKYHYTFTNSFENYLKLKKHSIVQNQHQAIVDNIICNIKEASKVELINVKEEIIDTINKELKWYQVYGGVVEELKLDDEKDNIINIYKNDNIFKYSFSNGTYYNFTDKKIKIRKFDEVYCAIESINEINEKEYVYIVSPVLAKSIKGDYKYLISNNITSFIYIGVLKGEIFVSDDGKYYSIAPDYLENMDLYSVNDTEFDSIYDGETIKKLDKSKNISKYIKTESINEFLECKNNLDKKCNYFNIQDSKIVNYDIELIPPYIEKDFIKFKKNSIDSHRCVSNNEFSIDVDYSSYSSLDFIKYLSNRYAEILVLLNVCDESKKDLYKKDLSSRLRKLSLDTINIPTINYFQNETTIKIQKTEAFIYEEYKNYLLWLNNNKEAVKVGTIYVNDSVKVLAIKYYDEIEEAIIEANNRNINVKVEA